MTRLTGQRNEKGAVVAVAVALLVLSSAMAVGLALLLAMSASTGRVHACADLTALAAAHRAELAADVAGPMGCQVSRMRQVGTSTIVEVRLGTRSAVASAHLV